MNRLSKVASVVLVTFCVVFGGCAHTFNANFSDFVSDLGPSHENDLDDFKFDPLPLNDAQTESEKVVDAIVETGSNDFLPETSQENFNAETDASVIHLQPQLPDTTVDRNQFNPATVINSKTNQSPEYAFAHRDFAPSTAKHAIAQEKLKISLVPVNENANQTETTTIVELPELRPNNTALKAIENTSEQEISTILNPLMPPPFADNPEMEPLQELVAIESTPKQLGRATDGNDLELELGLESELNFVDQLIAETFEMDSTQLVSMTVSSTEPVAETPWPQQLENTIQALERELESEGNKLGVESYESAIKILRSLKTVLESSEDGFFDRPELVESWNLQINALNSVMEQAEGADWSQNTTKALSQLNRALLPLRQAADLSLMGSCFCRKVTGYGQYETFEASDFEPNQKVLVYCEIENFMPILESESGSKKYRTKISSSCRITDSNGEVVQTIDYPAVSDFARNIRRDFFMHVPVQFDKLKPGSYQLQLMVEDFGSDKTATLREPLSFQIR